MMAVCVAFVYFFSTDLKCFFLYFVLIFLIFICLQQGETKPSQCDNLFPALPNLNDNKNLIVCFNKVTFLLSIEV